MLVGEAPGKTENRLGKPFIGRSGDLLRDNMNRVGLTNGYLICNVVCCIPWRSKHLQTIMAPSKEAASACQPHITQLVQLAHPKLVVLLGNEAKRWFPASEVTKVFGDVPLTHLRHPSYILRNGGKNSLENKRFLDAFHSALSDAGIACINPFGEQDG